MIEIYTLPIEFYDGDGGGNDREIAILQQSGRIRTRDKNLNGTLSRRRLARQNCHANSLEYKKDQATRVEAHRQRILLETALMRSKGIKPWAPNTAGEFDRLSG